jgi:hypothetical protein
MIAEIISYTPVNLIFKFYVGGNIFDFIFTQSQGINSHTLCEHLADPGGWGFKA